MIFYLIYINICPKRFILKMNPVITSAFFSTMKRKLGKEKSPAGEKIAGNSFAMTAKITTPHSLRSLVRQVIFAFAIAQNF